MYKTDLNDELSKNFIDYAAAVNEDRAIPDARDGLKPVALRVLYDSFDAGFTSSKPCVKCARIVGDTMSRLHPHGDSSIYEALVRLSQPWVMRYPLMDFHGNQGNISGDGCASMRYTESRTAKISEDGMLAGLKKNNVEFVPTYDEKDKEPSVLPAIFPNLLCNPNTGIGVSMASHWGCANLAEVAQAIYDYMDGKEPMIYPDFPTGGVIINKDAVPAIMKTGHGSVKIRGQYKIEKQNIIFYEIPYETTIERILDDINEAYEKKEIDGIKEVRNESKKNVRIVIECEKDANPEQVVKKLFLKTCLQTSFSYNQVALVDKTPTELGLEDCIKIYIKHNIECLKKELEFDINKAKERLHIVKGLLIALEDIDNVINLIKKSESSNAASVLLQEKYKLTEIQAKAILDIKLSKLAKLEKLQLEKERNELLFRISELGVHLDDENLQKYDIRARLEKIVKKYGDARRTQLLQIDTQKEDKDIEEIIPEDVVVIVSQTGNVKRIPKTFFKIQRKGGKGIKHADDAILTSISTNTIDNLMLFTSKGKMYKLLVDSIPSGTNTSKGTNVNSILKMESDEEVIAATSLYHNTKAKYVVFFTKNGLVKKTSLEEYEKIKRGSGIIAINLKDGDSLANVVFLDEEDVIIITKGGISIRFETKAINAIGRTTSGVKAIKLSEDDKVITGLPIHKETDNVTIFTSHGYGKKVKLDEFPTQARGGKGTIIYKPTDVTGYIIGAEMVDEEDNILLSGRNTSICISMKDVPLLGKVSIGNIVMKGDIVSAVKL